MSAARSNLGLENPTFLGQKNEVSATVDMWLQGRIVFFMQHFVTVHFPANLLISSFDYANIANHQQYY